jgi:hypothetical protein
MKLLKYPVTTPDGEYQVVVYERYITCGIYGFNADVQIPCNSMFRKFKTVYNISYWPNKFEEKYNHNYIKFAQDAIIQYEDSIKVKIERKKLIRENLAAWDQWDGIVR